MDGAIRPDGCWTGSQDNITIDFSTFDGFKARECSDGSVLTWKPNEMTQKNPFGVLSCERSSKKLPGLCISDQVVSPTTTAVTITTTPATTTTTPTTTRTNHIVPPFPESLTPSITLVQ